MAPAAQHVRFGDPVRFRTHAGHRLRGLALADTDTREHVPVAFHSGSHVRVRWVGRDDVESRRPHAHDKELRRFAATLRRKNIDEVPLEDLHVVARATNTPVRGLPRRDLHRVHRMTGTH